MPAADALPVAEPALSVAPAAAALLAERRVAQTAHGLAEPAPVAAAAPQLQVADALAAAISASAVVAHFAFVVLAALDCAAARAAPASAVARTRAVVVVTESSVVAPRHVALAVVDAPIVFDPADEAVDLPVGPGPGWWRVPLLAGPLAVCASPATADARSYRLGLPVWTGQPSAARAPAQQRYCLAELFAPELPRADLSLAAFGF